MGNGFESYGMRVITLEYAVLDAVVWILTRLIQIDNVTICNVAEMGQHRFAGCGAVEVEASTAFYSEVEVV